MTTQDYGWLCNRDTWGSALTDLEGMILPGLAECSVHHCESDRGHRFDFSLRSTVSIRKPPFSSPPNALWSVISK